MNDFINALHQEAEEEKAIIELMCVFPAYYQYKSNPTSEQIKELVREASKLGYTIGECVCVGEFMYASIFGREKDVACNNLYHIFTAGRIPDDLDELIKRLAQHWKPSGDIVESKPVKRKISEKQWGNEYYGTWVSDEREEKAQHD